MSAWHQALATRLFESFWISAPKGSKIVKRPEPSAPSSTYMVTSKVSPFSAAHWPVQLSMSMQP